MHLVQIIKYTVAIFVCWSIHLQDPTPLADLWRRHCWGLCYQNYADEICEGTWVYFLCLILLRTISQHGSRCFFKAHGCWFGQCLKQHPPARQTGTVPTVLTGWPKLVVSVNVYINCTILLVWWWPPLLQLTSKSYYLGVLDGKSGEVINVYFVKK